MEKQAESGTAQRSMITSGPIFPDDRDHGEQTVESGRTFGQVPGSPEAHVYYASQQRRHRTWYILVVGAFAALVDSTPQYDLCVGYCSVRARYTPTPASVQCSPETTYVTETVTETRTVTETKEIATTMYEPTTEDITLIAISTVYVTNEYTTTEHGTQSVVNSGITSYPATITTSVCAPKTVYGLSLGVDQELVDLELGILDQQTDCAYYTTTVWATAAVETGGNAASTTHVQVSTSADRSTDRSTDGVTQVITSTLLPSIESSANAYTSLSSSTATTITACPAPTTTPSNDLESPYDRNSNRTFGCVPGFVCDPPKPLGCNLWADSPADDYVCELRYCVHSPSYSRVHWPEGETGHVPLDEGYFNLNAHAFGLPYSIFESDTIVKNEYGKTYTITTGNWASATDLSVIPAPSPLAVQHEPPPMRGLPNHERRQEDGAPTAPAVCFDDCNNCYKEALAVGKSPALCVADSQFQQDFQLCISCIDSNADDGPLIRRLYVDQKFGQFLSFCKGLEPVPANSTSRMDTPSGAIATSELVTETETQLPGETTTSVQPIDSTPAPTPSTKETSGVNTIVLPQETSSSDVSRSGRPTFSSSGNEATQTTTESTLPPVNQDEPSETMTEPGSTSVDRDERPETAGFDDPAPEVTFSSATTSIDSGRPGSRPEGAATGVELSQSSQSRERTESINLDDPATNPIADSVEATPTRSRDFSSSAIGSPNHDTGPGEASNSTIPRQSEAIEEQPTAATPSFATGASSHFDITFLWVLAPLVTAIFIHRPL
ncbi:uncharacterized protein VDAG_02399 [Verticillium dahliae VdLs.17]|uniref:Glycoprotein X n=1 Tax=Verticillium dahliae (strain VdLs.17 / ATCC MYA-4575 / FGSC 10137) TaxID=498257 RepID=G2WXR7_VERDV|nr:uncharacterized protein VDAG_02399 [Verticillium dahliae VdLs.17]EGY20875.1 hypothetical protein VDAG_02399 [Verticillium dahliae VdLs.17]